jgi:hypothetical protein
MKKLTYIVPPFFSEEVKIRQENLAYCYTADRFTSGDRSWLNKRHTTLTRQKE